ncbi:MAG TPA: GAF domain-containing SpoIIE family protein phosphatase [Planctomycetaceae bacterium]|jgi:sigma-B regulation protein RsbU (phosphoserine phosphatase)|nr:GAF domain-containing SpoIIE family protein phosphatase [Planctomycetaceae bacterium]
MTAIADTNIATTNPDLTTELCRQFTRVTGWPLQFTVANRNFEDQQSELESDPDCRWFRLIGDENRPAGFLLLQSPEAGGHHSDLSEAVDFAAPLARLLGRLAEANAQLSLRNKDVSTLLNLGLAIPSHDDLAFALSQLLKAATHLTNSRCAAFFLLDTSTSRLKLRAVYQLAGDDVPCALRELRTSKPDLRALSSSPVALRAATPGGHPLFPAQMRRAMIVAVESEQVPFGTLWVYDRRAKAYSQRDMHVLQSIAAQVAAVLERTALLHGDQLQQRLCRDVRAASESQTDSNLQELPVDCRFEMAARCTSCYELGGDLCEVIRLSDDRTAIAVGDASGNSIPAAMIMSSVRGALLTHPADEADIAALVSKVNAGLCRIARSHQFMSLCYGVYDAANWRFTYCNAGHPMPLLVRDGQALAFESHGLLLGVLDDTNYVQSTLQLDRGDILIFYSDGISEARGRNQQLFRGRGIADAVQGLGDATAQQILDAIWDRVDEHQGAGEMGDDRTLLVLKVN